VETLGEQAHCISWRSRILYGEGKGQCGKFLPINYVINSTFRKIFNTRSQETVDVCLEMFGCLQAERTIAIRKCKFLNKFSIIHNALCRVFVVTAKTELESCSQTFS